MFNPVGGPLYSQNIQIVEDISVDLYGVIAIDSTDLGPAAGGCRLWAYTDQASMVNDAVQLARGMSLKNAMAGLPLGGGKAVLKLPGRPFDRRKYFEAFGRAVAKLKGSYITAEDVGTCVEDMESVSRATKYVAGLSPVHGKAGGNPSPWTALGVFEAMKVAAQVRFGRGLNGATVAVQGVGNVGFNLCQLLRAEGAKLVISDINTAATSRLRTELGARSVPATEILSVKADIIAPCALGGAINHRSIPNLKAGLVCGGANNQLACDRDGDILFRRGIMYVPDFVANAGGIINVSAEYLGDDADAVQSRVLQIGERVAEILALSSAQKRSTNMVAVEMAKQIMANGRQRSNR